MLNILVFLLLLFLNLLQTWILAFEHCVPPTLLIWFTFHLHNPFALAFIFWAIVNAINYWVFFFFFYLLLLDHMILLLLLLWIIVFMLVIEFYILILRILFGNLFLLTYVMKIIPDVIIKDLSKWTVLFQVLKLMSASYEILLDEKIILLNLKCLLIKIFRKLILTFLSF